MDAIPLALRTERSTTASKLRARTKIDMGNLVAFADQRVARHDLGDPRHQHPPG
jgi:hypothetical protein